jgi:hypothetical protein
MSCHICGSPNVDVGKYDSLCPVCCNYQKYEPDELEEWEKEAIEAMNYPCTCAEPDKGSCNRCLWCEGLIPKEA